MAMWVQCWATWGLTWAHVGRFGGLCGARGAWQRYAKIFAICLLSPGIYLGVCIPGVSSCVPPLHTRTTPNVSKVSLSTAGS